MGVPSSRSSDWIRAVRAGWLTYNVAAAALTVPCRATSRKASTCPICIRSVPTYYQQDQCYQLITSIGLMERPSVGLRSSTLSSEDAVSSTTEPTRTAVDFRDALHPSRAWILGVDRSKDRVELLTFDAPDRDAADQPRQPRPTVRRRPVAALRED